MKHGGLHPIDTGIFGSTCVCPAADEGCGGLWWPSREKRQVSRDMIEARRHLPHDFQVGARAQPWKIKNPWACCMSKEEATSFDPAFFQLSRECPPLLLSPSLALILLLLAPSLALMLLLSSPSPLRCCCSPPSPSPPSCWPASVWVS